MLSLFVDKNQKDWDDHLPYVLAAYRATQHNSTGVSPNCLMFNREIDCPIDVIVGQPPCTKQTECPIQYVQWVQTAMLDAFEFTHEQLGTAANRQNGIMTNLKSKEYARNDWVWRFYPPTAGMKLGMGWVGPYLVVKRISYLVYRIQKSEESQPITVHVDDIKPFIWKKHPKSWLDEPE